VGVGVWLDAHRDITTARSATTYGTFASAVSNAESAPRREKLGAVLVGVGGGALIAGLIHYYVVSRSAERAPLRVWADVRPDGITASIGTTY
jgi:hypothetical protein